jgi:soluble lytic murein transglycosylase
VKTAGTPSSLSAGRVWLGIATVIAATSYASLGQSVAAPPVVDAAAAAPFVESDLWLRPTEGDAPALGRAAADLASGNAKEALTAFQRAASDPVLGGYARLYQGRAELALDRPRDAEASARQVIGTTPGGALGESALWLMADAAEKHQDWSEALRALQALSGLTGPSQSLAYLRVARIAMKTNDLATARDAFSRVYYDFPLSAEAAEAEMGLKSLTAPRPDADLVARELARAERLYAGRRYADARKAFASLAGRAPLGDPALAALRVAECDLYLQHYKDAYVALVPIARRSGSPRADEAGYGVATALRLMKKDTEYLTAVRQFVDTHPTSPFAEQLLNELATYHILADRDADAAAVFTDMVNRWPKGTFAERAVWKGGWWAYRNGDYVETLRLFEIGLANFSRADYRPSWLYWSARANQKLGRIAAARAGFQQTIASYRNSYYGRQAAQALGELPGSPATASVGVDPPAAMRARPAAFPSAGDGPAQRPATQSEQASLAVVPGRAPANIPLVRALLLAGLHDDAIAELRKVQREEGTSPYIEATIAYALNRKGDLRGAINAMRRAYPQFMAEGGEQLPVGILKVIFPLDYWDLIHRQARAANLDPYLTAALVAQESTFQADVRSAANAWGLMQILPATGRRYASSLGLGRFTTSRLTDPNVNVRIGTAYFADLMRQFGDPAFALAAYNAGENRIERWLAERPGVPRDEFIDDIPFPETQNYVKRIIGTAEDYRILYGGGAPAAVR